MRKFFKIFAFFFYVPFVVIMIVVFIQLSLSENEESQMAQNAEQSDGGPNLCPAVASMDVYRVSASIYDQQLTIIRNEQEVTKEVSNHQKYIEFLKDKNAYLYAQSGENWVLIPMKRFEIDFQGRMLFANYVRPFFILNGKVVEEFAFPVISHGDPHYVVHSLDGAKSGDSLIIVRLKDLVPKVVGSPVWRDMVYRATDRSDTECCEAVLPYVEFNIGSNNIGLEVLAQERDGFLIKLADMSHFNWVLSSDRTIDPCVPI